MTKTRHPGLNTFLEEKKTFLSFKSREGLTFKGEEDKGGALLLKSKKTNDTKF